MAKPDITTLTAAADRLLEKTDNPRHRQMRARYSSKRFDVMMFWRYDERARLVGEHVVDAGPAQIVEVSAEDFITPAEATSKLRPLIRPLPRFG